MSLADRSPAQRPQPTSELQGEVAFRPFGGLGEIGMNCFALEDRGQVLVIDCGATFPDDDIGVDLLVPDFSWLWERQRDIVGVFVTHGHEDHIGAIPHFLGGLQRSVPIFAPPHASALIAERLSEHDVHGADIRVVRPGQKYEVGKFVVEPIAVAHSIVDATALCIETSAGRILHTADFDLDSEQPAGYLTDERRLQELGDEGVRLLLSDSTNIDSPQRPHSEGDVGRTLGKLVAEQKHRVVVAMFSSNGHRMQALLDAANATGRKVCLLGRSLVRQLRVSTELRYLRYPSNLLASSEELARLPREKVLVIAGGSQGEAASSLRRLSLGQHPALELEEGDVVIHSARVIPGNEKPVLTMLSDFERRKVTVITRREVPSVHTSGHAARDELERMLTWIRPTSFVPLHGTLHHMRAHESLARSIGVDDTRVVENGSPIFVPPEGALRVGPAREASVVRIAFGGEVLASRQRRRRTELGRHGVIAISAAVDEQGNPVGLATITSAGVAGVDDDPGALSVLQATTREALNRAKDQRMSTSEDVLKRALRGVVTEMSGEKPLIFVHLLRVR